MATNIFATLMILCIFNVIFIRETTSAASGPSSLPGSRQKRVSEQRLAELETLLGLLQMKGQIVTVPIAFGLLDPKKIGRKRRSVVDEKLEVIQREMQIIASSFDMIHGTTLDEKTLPWLSMKLKEMQQRIDNLSVYLILQEQQLKQKKQRSAKQSRKNEKPKTKGECKRKKEPENETVAKRKKETEKYYKKYHDDGKCYGPS